MLLSRLERELSKPINWGERTYWNMKKREDEALSMGDSISSTSKSLGLNSRVRKALEDHAVVTGPLDASKIIEKLSEEELCLFFPEYTQCQNFILTSWFSISTNVLRCISMTFAESLIELDMSRSHVQASHLEILLVRAVNIRVLKLNRCPQFDLQATRALISLCNSSLEELYLHCCPRITNDCLIWIGGKGSLSGIGLSKLRALDISHCSGISDNGLVALANGCRKLRFLNLENLHEITDKSLVEVIKASKKLQLLNLNGLFHITNKTTTAIGKTLKDLVSLNLSRCSQITDKGIKPIAMGCKTLQAINLSGLLKISEESMFCLADSCKGLMTMNLTGCERITTNGLENLVMGLPCITKAITFFGFIPLDSFIEKKLENSLKMIVDGEAKEIEEELKRQKQAEDDAVQKRKKLIFNSAVCIQSYLYRYKKRMYFYHLWQLRLQKVGTATIQRLYRGYRGRLKAKIRKKEYEAFLACTPQAIKLQSHIRGFLCRLKNGKVSKVIREMYSIRRREVESALAVRIQTHLRKFLAKKYVVSYRELKKRYIQNINDAILVLQMLARRFLSKMQLFRRRTKKRNLDEARLTAALKINKFTAEGIRRYRSKLTGENLKRYFRHKWAAVLKIQSIYRGFKARERVKHIKIDLATKHYAAREIQRVFRGSRVLHYKDLRMNVIAAFVLDRHYIERKVRMAASRERYRQYLLLNQKDSASEPDTEEDDLPTWVKSYDGKKKLPYWQNYATNEITYDEPLVPLAHEKGMIGKRVKVHWVVQV
jgi:hypothetical protein